MKTPRRSLFLFAVLVTSLLVLTSWAGSGYAQSQPAATDDPVVPWQLDLPEDSADKPVFEGGSPNRYPIISYQQPPKAEHALAPNALNIVATYGDTQSFGLPGTSQVWANIIGVVEGASQATTTVTYSLNGGSSFPLSLGPDQRRLYEANSFNIELNFSDLLPGANVVAIQAVDGGMQDNQNVTVNYTPGVAWPLNYSINWSGTADIQDVASVVTGNWEIVGDEIRTVNPGYDRLLAIGDLSWTDYELTVPITVESLNDTEWGAPSFGGGVGFITNWQGHYLMDQEQPRLGWRRSLSTLTWFRWGTNGASGFQMLGFNGTKTIASSNEQISLNTTYMFKLSIQSSPIQDFPSTYRFKYWPVGDPEPALWTMTAEGLPGEPATGSVLLVAHQAMVRFGDVTVRPLSSIPAPKVKIQSSPNGTVVVEPDKPSYDYGDTVSVRALGNSGFVLSNWSGNLSGNQNPVVFDITQDVTIKANFVPGANPTLTITADGDGGVEVSPEKSSYQYGEEVTLVPQPNPGFLFAGWNGDLSGGNNPATVVMNGDKVIGADFVSADASSPVSDDFNSCELDTDLWTFQNPVGDGTVEVTGTQLILTAPGGLPHDIWLGGNRSVRVIQPTNDSNFEIITKFDSVVSKRFQMQGILINQDPNNYLRLEVHHDGATVETYGAKFVNGAPTPVISKTPLASTPAWLRITRTGDDWGFSYSFDGDEWFAAGSFSHTMTVSSSGVFAGNQSSSGTQPPEHKTIVDYFFNSLSPIVPEDGGTIGVTVDIQGNGTVSRSPDQPQYACGDVVTLTANPASGWVFAGWSGDVTGNQAVKEVTITGALNTTATFVPQAGGFKTYLPAVISQ